MRLSYYLHMGLIFTISSTSQLTLTCDITACQNRPHNIAYKNFGENILKRYLYIYGNTSKPIYIQTRTHIYTHTNTHTHAHKHKTVFINKNISSWLILILA